MNSLESTTEIQQGSIPSNTMQPAVLSRTSFLPGIALAFGIIFVLPLTAAIALNVYTSKQSEKLISPVAIDASTSNPFNGTQTAAEQSTNYSQELEYELSLATRFLSKAVELSNTPGEQTIQDKDKILSLLNQALESSNRAITLNASDARGFTSRGRVYQALVSIKPELQPLADADFQAAQSLGATTPMQAPVTQEPLELLPTQQASTGQTGYVIAGPEEQDATTIEATTQQNANKGKATIEPGVREVVVPYPQVRNTTQLYLAPEENDENITFYVKNKQEGVGFTVATTVPPTKAVALNWWEVEQ